MVEDSQGLGQMGQQMHGELGFRLGELVNAQKAKVRLGELVNAQKAKVRLVNAQKVKVRLVNAYKVKVRFGELFS